MLTEIHGAAPPSRRRRGFPAEALLVGGSALGIFLAIACGAYISSFVPPHNPWLFMAAFAAPAAVAFAVYWLISRRF